MAPTSLARLFIKPEFCLCPLRIEYEVRFDGITIEDALKVKQLTEILSQNSKIAVNEKKMENGRFNFS